MERVEEMGLAVVTGMAEETEQAVEKGRAEDLGKWSGSSQNAEPRCSNCLG
jgi:hypothetical protein